MSANLMPASNLLADLSAIVGPAHVLTSDTEREFYSMDVYNHLKLPLAVVQPGTVVELQQVVRTAITAGVAVVPRGGGASYTDGYLPTLTNSILLDTGRLNRIVELNAGDMYVTVEPGITWAELWQMLKAKGLRTTFWGPFSGIKATVGGSMSQNSASLGSGNYGVSADAVLAFEIVLANGEILKPGSHAAANGAPFFRWYGPDLTGLFTGDAGALGVKVRITLKLIKSPPLFGAASFGFDTFENMSTGMAVAAREGRCTHARERRTQRTAPAGCGLRSTARDRLADHGFTPLSFGNVYQPVTIERNWFHTPLISTSNTCTSTNNSSPVAAKKCRVRADCRPPSRSTQPVTTASSRGDIARPATITNGSRPKITVR